MDICFVCGKVLDSDRYNVGPRARQSLIKANALRRDTHNEHMLHNQDICIHLKCYKIYTSEKLAVVAGRRSLTQQSNEQENVSISEPSSSSQPDTTSSNFDWRKCFICDLVSENVDPKNPKRQNATSKVTKSGLYEQLMARLRNRKDPEALEIRSRIENVDLVAVGACYHRSCQKKLAHVKSGQTRGRSKSPVDSAMQHIYDYLEENAEECQFTVSHLSELIPEHCRPNLKTIKTRLEVKYGEDIILYDVRGAGTVICFKNTGHKLLTEVWYKDKARDEESERHRVVREAGAIIREEIRGKLYETQCYPATSSFLDNADTDITACLRIFLEEVILAKKKSCLEKWKRKVTAIAHAIIKATRPRSFVSSILLGVGCFLKKKFASRLLIDTLASIGFSCSYADVELLEVACATRKQPTVLPNGFSQWVADNADYNINTLDGFGSWHVMAVIQCVTPSTAIEREENVNRQPKDKLINLAEIAKINLETYDIPPSAGLNTIHVLNLDDIYPPSKEIVPRALDLLWIYGKWSCDDTIPGWNGFMEQVTQDLPFHESKILYLPFINSPPTDNTTVNTTLLHACKVGNAQGMHTKFVTFDQQLYWKAVDIVATARADSELKHVVVRLGGFHLLMSFMGVIGRVMSGSGLKHLWETIFAEGSIPQMLLGKAYARAVRAHILANLSLAKIVLDSVDPDDLMRDALDIIITDLDRTTIFNAADDDMAIQFTKLFAKQLEALEKQGPTAQLWVQYYRMTTLIKHFLEAERTGNWDLHIATIRSMLPFFHSSGHFNYAKSAHLYLQDMASLKDRMTSSEFSQFTERGYFTIRRSKKFFAGIFSDQTIEQTTMRHAKSHEGLTVHGRGITDNVTAKWTLSMYSLMNISEQFEIFTDIYDESSEQHVDMRSSRVIRDNSDIEKLDTWFASHYPFPKIEDIVSIGTGIVGDSTINCYQAETIGNEMMKRIIGQTFGSLKFRRNDIVKPLSNMTAGIKIKDATVSIDPMLIFHRIAISTHSNEDLQQYLQYELSPYPLSLFDEAGMRKGTKSSYYEAFTPIQTVDLNLGLIPYQVLDGGYLLHKVKWDKHMSIDEICGKYIAYLAKHHQSHSTSVIFDGYLETDNSTSTKGFERQRRSRKHFSAAIKFDRSTKITVTQELFLSNDKNKSSFIKIITPQLEAAGFEVQQAFEDADRLIVEAALDKSLSYDSVTIIGEDIDLLVLITALARADKNIYLKKPAHGKTPERIYSCTSFKHDVVKNYALFIHAFTGCDTTSAPYFQGKSKLIGLLSKDQTLRIAAENFNTPNNHCQAVEGAGQAMFVALYGGFHCKKTLAELRFQKFTQSATRTKSNLTSLPPSPDAANQHSRRVYYQVQVWLGNHLDPLEWGWQKTARGLEPIRATKEAAPDNLLKLITCGCKTNCGAACGCRKAGIVCSVACKYCSGENCSNVALSDMEIVDYEDDTLKFIDQCDPQDSDSLAEENSESDIEEEIPQKKRKIIKK